MNHPTRQEVQESIAREMKQIHAQIGAEAKAKAKADGHTEVDCGWLECKACEAGLGTTLAAVIVAAIAAFPEDEPLLAEIAEAVGLSEDVVEAIFKKFVKDGLKSIISELCKAMGACC